MNDIEVTFDWANKIQRKYVCASVRSRLIQILFILEEKADRNPLISLPMRSVYITAEILLCRS